MLPEFNKQLPEFNKQLPEFNKQLPEFNKQLSEFNQRLPEFNKRLPEFNKRLPEFNQLCSDIYAQANIGTSRRSDAYGNPNASASATGEAGTLTIKVAPNSPQKFMQIVLPPSRNLGATPIQFSVSLR